MANVSSGEVVFPIFVSLTREPRNESEIEEVKQLIEFSFSGYTSEIESINWHEGRSIEIKFRVLDWDDFDTDVLQENTDELEDELKDWEEREND